VSDFSGITQSNLDQAEDIVRTILFEAFPNLDLSDGSVLSELLGGPNAHFYVYCLSLLDQYRVSSTLYELGQSSTLTSDYVVDSLMSNYNVARSTGTTATGTATIILSSSDVTTIPTGTTFTTAGNLPFVTEDSFNAVPSSQNVSAATDRLIIDRGDGTYSFSVNITASAVGLSYNIGKDTSFTLSVVPSNFVRSYAESDFSGGTDAETTSDLLSRLNLGMASVGLGSRLSIKSLIASQFLVKHISITGVGDDEMLRDRHNIQAMSTGGKADIYLSTGEYPIQSSTTKTATLINVASGIWQLSVAKNDFPGFYSVASILPLNSTASGSLEIYQETRFVDTSGDDYVPGIEDITEGGYSRYQTSVIQFIDTATASGKAVGATASYTLSVYMMNNIGAIQDYLNLSDIRDPCSDYLVRAAVPFFVSVSMQLEKVTGSDTPNTSSMKTAIASAINSHGFKGSLPASLVTSAVSSYLTDGVTVKYPIELLGQLRYPDGTVTALFDTKELVVPDAPTACVTKNTVLFYVDPTDIAISVTEVD
jgi:hypothetical protein